MPSITKAALEDLETSKELALADLAGARERAVVAEAKTTRFNGILDKIVRAAEGRPLVDQRNDYGGAMSGVSNYLNVGYGSHDSRDKPDLEERQAVDIRNLTEEVAQLRARLASVVAVATFAQEHKA